MNDRSSPSASRGKRAALAGFAVYGLLVLACGAPEPQAARPAPDALFGVYRHLGSNQSFEVAFSRVRE